MKVSVDNLILLKLGDFSTSIYCMFNESFLRRFNLKSHNPTAPAVIIVQYSGYKPSLFVRSPLDLGWVETPDRVLRIQSQSTTKGIGHGAVGGMGVQARLPMNMGGGAQGGPHVNNNSI